MLDRTLPTRRRAMPVLATPVLLTLALAPLVVVVGCSTPAPRAADAPAAASVVDDFPRSRLVALDFVDAMVQIPELEPTRTTLYTARPRSRFGEILVVSLQNAGYDLRLGAEGDAETLGYDVRAEDAPVGEAGAGKVSAANVGAGRYTFFVTAGTVRMKRTYGVDASGIRPATAMRLHGTDVTALESSPSLFDAPPLVAATSPLPLPLPSSSLSAVPTLSPVALSSPAPSSPAPRSSMTPAPAPRSSAAPVATASASPVPLSVAAPVATTFAPPAPSRLPDLRRKTNMYETRRSNYEDLLATYDTVRRDIMVFPNDSLHMGRDNKRLARTLAAAFDPERDVISVIGCSHGRTALQNGNETLANGRSYRVKEALMLAGVDADLVLEEGCWAGTHFESMPARGVVVTHKRRARG